MKFFNYPAILKIMFLSILVNFALAAPIYAKANENNPFSKLIGEWLIKDYSLTKSGEWQEANGADWNFYWILDGAAIQDDWISPSMSKPTPKTGRQLGTNIRIFNPKTDEWEMAWIANTGKQVENFKAKNIKDTVVMKGDYQGIPTIITFYDIRKNHFSWKMERPKKNDKGEYTDDWRVLYKIEGTRKN